MHEYAFDQELVRLAILLGVVVSMLFYDKYRVTTGGAIVPGYMALFFPSPTHIVVLLLIAVVTNWIVQRYLRPRYMLWGRRLFESEILIALILQTVWVGVLALFIPQMPELALLYGIGFVLPGIMAHDMGRQGVRTTVWAALVCAFIVFGLITLIGGVRDISGLSISAAGPIRSAQIEQYAYPREWLIIGIVFSVAVSMVLYRRGFFLRDLLADPLRTGGFVTAGYLALFVTRPLDLLFVLVWGAITYVIVTQFFMKQAILFGRTKVAAMFLTGMMVTWLAEILLAAGGFGYVPWSGFNAIAPTIIALLANDAQRQYPHRTFLGVGVSTAVVFVLMFALGVGYRLVFVPS